MKNYFASIVVLTILFILSPVGLKAQTSVDTRGDVGGSGIDGGAIIPGQDGEACNGSKAGALRWHPATNCLEFCDGENWTCPSLNTTPDAFTFTDQTGVATSTVITSNSVTINGIDASTPVSVSGDGSPEIRINGGSWATSGNIENGQTLEVRLTSNAANSTMNSATIDVGGVTDQWDVTTIAPDTTPDAFTFTDQTDVATATLITSNSVTINGIDASTPVSVSGDGSPEIRINGGIWTTSGNTENGQTLEVRLTSNAANSAMNSATIDVGGVTDQWDVTTGAPADTTPDAFSFTDQTDVATSTVITSNSVTINGIDASTPVSVSGDGSPEIRINGGSWATSGNIENGQTLEVRLTSNAANSTMNSATVDVGGVADQWDVTTVAPADTTPDAFSFTDQTGVATSTVITSNSVTINGIDASTPVSVSGDGSPEIRINGGSWATSGNIENGQTLEVRLTSNAANSTMNSATVDVGGVTDQWDVTTGAPDTTPDPFNFADRINVATSTVTSSTFITITGINASTPVSVSGDGSPEISINYGGWVTSGTITNGQTLIVRLTSSSSIVTSRFATVNVGGVSDVWEVRTERPACPGTPGAGDEGCLMPGGSYFAGDGNLYVAPLNQSTFIRYSTVSEINTGAQSMNDGQANQAWIVANRTLSQYPAFQLCENLNQYGHADWYVPSINETGVLYNNRDLIGGFNNQTFWSSTEEDSTRAMQRSFFSGGFSGNPKGNNFDLRCVRRG